MANNIQSVDSMASHTAAEDFEAYDKLAPEVRKFVQQAPMNLNSIFVAEHVQLYGRQTGLRKVTARLMEERRRFYEAYAAKYGTPIQQEGTI